MKKIFYLLAILFATLSFTACTESERTRYYGGSQTIELPAGQKLVEATWKDADLWYLTEPMEADYVPKTKIFSESSNWGIMEGTITFIEKR